MKQTRTLRVQEWISSPILIIQGAFKMSAGAGRKRKEESQVLSWRTPCCCLIAHRIDQNQAVV